MLVAVAECRGIGVAAWRMVGGRWEHGARSGRRNTDYSTRGLSANEIIVVVQAWQNGALSRDSMLDIFRRCEVLPEGRTNEEEVRLIEGGRGCGREHDNTTQGPVGIC